MGSENVKKGVNHWDVPYHIQVWKCPLPPPPWGGLLKVNPVFLWIASMHL